MKPLAAVAVLLFVAASGFGQAAKPCEELKGEIAKKIEANKVTSYSLEIVATKDVKEGEGKVVGSCDGGTKKIVYRRGAAEESAAKTKPAAEQTKSE